MNEWNDEQKQVKPSGSSFRRLSEVSGADTLEPPSEGDNLDSQRGSDSTGNEGKGVPSPVSGNTSPPPGQFIDSICKYCKHIQGMHFYTKDEIGSWSFCVYCDCFLDVRNEE